MDLQERIAELESEREEYRTRAMHWRTECDKRDRRIHDLETFLRLLSSHIVEKLQ